MKASAKYENPRYCTYEDLRIGVLVSDSAVIAATCKRLKSVEDFVLVSDYLSTLPSPEVPPAGGGWVVLGLSQWCECLLVPTPPPRGGVCASCPSPAKDGKRGPRTPRESEDKV